MPDKFKTLVHYVCWKCRDDPTKLGAVKLNKVLWFADTLAFRLFGREITGARYTKQAKGPVPKPILPTLCELQAEEAISVSEVPYYRHKQRQFVALREPDLSALSEAELRLVDDVIEAVCDRHTANSISEATHDAVWKLAQEGEEIPLYATLVSRSGKITNDDVRVALTRMKAAAQGWGHSGDGASTLTFRNSPSLRSQR